MKFSERLKIFREENNLTQEQLAELSGVSIKQIEQYESDEAQPHLDIAEKLAGPLHISAEELLGKSIPADSNSSANVLHYQRSSSNTLGKVLKVITTIFTAIVCVFTVLVMIFTIISVTTFDRNNRSLFGFKMFIVLSDSMSATDFNAGDVVLVKEADFSEFEVGDIVCFSSVDTSNYGETVTHKIREITTNDNGEAAFVTYGTTTGVDDATLVTAPYVKGRYVGHIPHAGTIFTYLKTTPGYICCILIPFLILILIQAINSIKLFRQYKAEQAAVIAEEKAKLEAERAESMKMLDELQALKAQLAAMKDDSAENAESSDK